MSIMRTVEEVGRVEVGAAGEVWYPSIQMSYVGAALGHTRYSDNNRARVRRHTLIIGPRGARKSSSTKGFLSDYCGVVPASTDSLQPRMLDMNGMGFERCRGSATMDGDLIQPLFTQADIGYMSETMTFLEQSGDIAKTANQMNVAMEEGHMGVSLVKMFKRYEDDEREDIVRKMARYGVTFDADNCIMYYDVPTTFIGCSRPFMPKELQILDATGFRDRLEESIWMASKDGFRSAWREGPRPSPENGQDILAFNRKMWELDWLHVPYPDRELMDMVIGKYDKFYEHLEEEIGAHPTETRSFRDWSDAAQVVTGFAAMRICANWDADNNGNEVPTIKYTERDAVAAVNFAEKMFLQRYMEMSELAKTDQTAVSDQKALMGFLSEENIDDVFRGPAFVSWVAKNGSKMGLSSTSRSAAYDCLNRCRDRGWVHGIKYATYALDEKVQVALESGRFNHHELVA